MVKALDKKSEFLFPTQIVSGQIPDFDQIQNKLIDWIYEYKENNEGIAKISNKGGWQSERKDVFVDESFKQFENIIIPVISELVDEYKLTSQADIVQMWINVNGANSYNVSHRHPGADFSGVLWIKQTPKQGRFIFDNIDVGYRDATILYNIDSKYLEEKRMLPEWYPSYKNGTVMIFPAMFSHRVEINETQEERISISFNIKLK